MNQQKIAVVIPTIRPEHFKKFSEAWAPLLKKHDCQLVTVIDGENPTVNGYSAQEIMGEYSSALSNFNAGIRNLGFAYVAHRMKDVEIVLTFDDDVMPIGDTIQDHLDALNQRVPTSWLSTASKHTRGFPYGIRSEAEVVLSHGVWQGVADWDAPTQLVIGNQPISFYKGPIPKGIYFPMCSMNLAFKRKLLPHIYHAPWALGINRFDDVFAGIEAKKEIDKNGWAAVSGCSIVHHDRASDVFNNLKNEAPGIALNETFWKGNEDHPYFKIYRQKLKVWQEFINLRSTISFIIPSVGRKSLKKTLSSIERWPGDEVLVIKHDPPSKNWGNAERQEGTNKAKCDYLAFIDDDDVYIPGARAIMDKAIRENPGGKPILFKIKYPNGRILWQKKWVKNGNVSTQMILVPNKKDMLYDWDQKHTWADFQFINRWKWPAKTIDWREEIIVHMGHNDEKYEKKLTFAEARKGGYLS